MGMTGCRPEELTKVGQKDLEIECVNDDIKGLGLQPEWAVESSYQGKCITLVEQRR